MQSNWQIFFESFGGQLTALAALGFLFTALITFRFKRHEIAYSWLHQERAKAIVAVYDNLVKLILLVDAMTNKKRLKTGNYERHLRNYQAQAEEYRALWNEVRLHFFKNKLYFDTKLAMEIGTLIGTYNTVDDAFLETVEDTIIEKQEFFKLYERLSVLLLQIEKKFQKLLAVR